MPCPPSDPNAIKMSIYDIKDTKMLLPPKVELHDFMESISKNKSSIDPKQLKRFEEWTVEFGQDA